MLRGLNHITIAVGDLDTSFDFYIQLLGFKPLARWDAGAYLSLGIYGSVYLAIQQSPARTIRILRSTAQKINSI